MMEGMGWMVQNHPLILVGQKSMGNHINILLPTGFMYSIFKPTLHLFDFFVVNVYNKYTIHGSYGL